MTRLDPLLVQVWLVTRVGLAVVLVAALVLKGRRPVNALANWDVQHYLTVATAGYADPQEMAFFPGLPAVMRVVGWFGVPGWASGAVFAVICSFLAAWALYRIAGGSQVMGQAAACLWLIAPTAVFTTVAYSEAPFCAAAFWAWERARKGKWFDAALFAAVACTFRVSGLFLVGALVVLALIGDGDYGSRDGRLPDWGQRLRDVAWLLIPLAVLALWSTWLYHLSGSWTAWFDAQKAGWGRGLHTPREAFEATWRAARPSSWPEREKVARVFQAELVTMAVGLITTVICLVRRRWASASWVAVMCVAFGTSVWWMSISRAALLWFPTFVLLGEVVAAGSERRGSLWANRVRRWLIAGSVTCSVLAMPYWAWLFFTGEWAS